MVTTLKGGGAEALDNTAATWAVAMAARRDALRVYPNPPANTTREAAWDGRQLPLRPYAVYLHDAAGATASYGLDFDAGQGAADREARAVLARLRRVGIPALLVGSGPGGGRHVWARFAPGLPRGFAAGLTQRLRTDAGSLDIGPLMNWRTGALRPPGAPHRLGGTAQLLDPPLFADAWAFWQCPATLAQAQQLLDQLPPTPFQQPAQMPRPSGVERAPSAYVWGLLMDGDAAHHYRSRSELEFAILVGLLDAGWTTVAIEHAARDARFRGFPKYQALLAQRPRRALQYWQRSMANALAWVAMHPATGSGGEEPALRQIREAAAVWHPGTRTAAVDCAVLAAHLAAAQAAGSVQHALSVRACAEAAGLRDLHTVQRARARLSRAGWLVPTGPGEAPTAAHHFALRRPRGVVLPLASAPVADGKPRGVGECVDFPPPWFVRPYRDARIGDARDFVGAGPMESYAILRATAGPLSLHAVARRVGHDRTTVRTHLRILAEQDLVEQTPAGHWVAVSDPATRPAPPGGQRVATERRARYARERILWRRTVDQAWRPGPSGEGRAWRSTTWYRVHGRRRSSPQGPSRPPTEAAVPNAGRCPHDAN